jgi:hypothetical protein
MSRRGTAVPGAWRPRARGGARGPAPAQSVHGVVLDSVNVIVLE